MHTIVIDPGHGGQPARGKSTPWGSRGPRGTLEKDLTLDLARRIAQALGPQARLTRQGDENPSLAERAGLGRFGGVFLSLHADADEGPEVWIHSQASPASLTLASAIGRRLGGRAGEPRRGDLAVLHPPTVGLDTAACFVDVGALARVHHEEHLGRPGARDALALAISEGVREYMNHRGHGRLAWGAVVTFPSGQTLTTTTGATGANEEYWDPTGANLPLLDVSGAERDKYLSTNFTAGELAHSGSTNFSIARIDPELVRALQALRDRVAQAVTVTSSFRTWAYNVALYAPEPATHSQHCAGKAADVQISGMSGLQIAKEALLAYGPTLSIGLAANFCHIDVRGSFASWTYTSYANGQADLAELRAWHTQQFGGRTQGLAFATAATHREDTDVGEQARHPRFAALGSSREDGEGWPFEGGHPTDPPTQGLGVYDTYSRMTPCERAEAIRHPIEAYQVYQLAQEAVAEAQRQHPGSGLHNDAGDAFRHAYWNLRMAQELGATRAQVWADCHEEYPGNPPAEKAMDLFNNDVGRRLHTAPESVLGGTRASWSGWSAVDLVCEAARQGKLQTAP